MYKNIVILGYKFDLLQLSLVVTTTIFFILLGNWQLDRLGQKETLITKIEQSLINSPVQLQKDTEIYSKVRITGKFLNDNIFLYGRRSATKEKDGYYLLTTFVSDQGQKFLVSRGWLGQSTKDNFIALRNKEKEEVIAIMLPGEIKRFFIPSNDIKQNIWFTLDLSMAKELYKLDNNSYYLMQITAKNLPQNKLQKKVRGTKTHKIAKAKEQLQDKEQIVASSKNKVKATNINKIAKKKKTTSRSRGI